MKHILWLFIVAVLFSLAHADTNLTSVWNLDLKGFSFDISKWDSAFKERVIQALIVVGAFLSVRANYPIAAAIGIGVFGLVKLSYLLSLTLAFTVYSFYRKQMLWAGLGFYLSYTMAWGKSWL